MPPPKANFSSRQARAPVVIDINDAHVREVERAAERQADDTGVMLQHALDVREDNIELVSMMQKAADRGNEDADEIARMLAQDRERIERIDDKIKSMDSTIERGRRELVAIIRNMCRDRCFTFLIIFGLVAVSIIGAVFIRDSIKEANQKDGDTVVVQPAAPAPTAAPAAAQRRSTGGRA
jgi:hypothetical protein